MSTADRPEGERLPTVYGGESYTRTQLQTNHRYDDLDVPTILRWCKNNKVVVTTSYASVGPALAKHAVNTRQRIAGTLRPCVGDIVLIVKNGEVIGAMKITEVPNSDRPHPINWAIGPFPGEFGDTDPAGDEPTT